MRLRLMILTAVLCLAFISCTGEQTTSVQAPDVEKKPEELVMHGDVRVDPYFWIKERENPDVIAYLEAENEYTDAMMADTKELQDTIFEEIKGRIKQDDASPPYRLRGYYYYTRYEEGKEYPIYCRKEGSLDAEEQVMLDVNAMAEGHSFFAVRGLTVSPENDMISFGVDTVSRRKYTLHFKNLGTGEILADEIADMTGNNVWANDNKTVFYAKQDPETLRSYQIYRYVVGSGAEPELIYQEDDDTFSCYVNKTKSDAYIIIHSGQTLSDEVRYLDANNPTGQFQVLEPRERGLEYSVDHFAGNFYIRTNLDAENFRLMRAPVNSPGKANWSEVIGNRDDVYLQSFEIFRDYLVVTERKGGLRQIRIMPWRGEGEHYLQFDEPAYVAFVSTNPELDSEVLRYGYQSMTTPSTIYDYNMSTREREMVKQDEVLGGFDQANYKTERIDAPADDGTMVPISLVYRIDKFNGDGSNPALLYSYGSYGSTTEPYFRSTVISLLDRGFVYALAHVRGGSEYGRSWYEHGKLLNKKNTFTDFNDCAHYLVDENYTSTDKLFAMGGSAGGLLMGAIANMEPELYKGIIAHVPWVDVVTTMLDDSIPLTTSEYDEWGNPNDKVYYDYMLSYSPYDNVKKMAYPAMLVTTGLHDSQVQYWEPTKWVAKLRDMKTDDNLLILKTNMEAGHGGASGRYERYHETAFDYAFMLKELGMVK